MKTKIIVILLTVAFFAIRCENIDKTIPTNGDDSYNFEINDTVKIDFEKTVIISSNNIKIRFDSLIHDSRCPINAICVWPGTAEIALMINIDNEEYKVHLHTYPNNDNFIILDGYYFELVNVSPYPDTSVPHEVDEYKVEVLVLNLEEMDWTYGTVVDKNGLDGCGLIIETTDGKLLDPRIVCKNVDLIPNQPLVFKYLEITGWASTCMAGDIIKIIKVQGDDATCTPIIYELDSLDANLPGDVFDIQSYTINGNCLTLTVGYGGGCKQHHFKMIRGYDLCGTPPLPPPMFYIVHDSNGDMCEAYITKDISFDLTSIQQDGQSKVLFTVTANNGNFNETLEYSY